MESIFNFKDFRKFIRISFSARSKGGHGEATKLARALSVNNTFISQVLKGDKSLSLEQAFATANYLSLNEFEAEFFVLLVQLDRAGTREYKNFIEKQLARLKGKSEKLANRVKHETKISEEQRAVFYSDWVYSAVRLSTQLSNLKTVESLAEHFALPVAKVREVIEFLLIAKILKLECGELSWGATSTHLEASSPWIKSHHANWRQKAIEEISHSNSKSLHYSAPMTLSKSDAARVREVLIQSINAVDEILTPSPSEELHCLNIDWFSVR